MSFIFLSILLFIISLAPVTLFHIFFLKKGKKRPQEPISLTREITFMHITFIFLGLLIFTLGLLIIKFHEESF